MTEVEKIPAIMDSSMLQIGEAYANALIASGQHDSSADRLVEALTQFEVVLQKLPKLREILVSPKVDVEAKIAILDKALRGRAEGTFLNFTKILARRGRFECFPAIVSAAVALQDAQAGRVRARVTTASPMNAESQANLEQRLSSQLGKTVLVTVEVDPKIIGGVVVRIGDTVYDASVVNRLKQVKTKAIKGISDAIRASVDRFTVEV